eukprot:scaffold25182_cov62-Phaeocystis_antarctica.AAC.4
MPEIGISALFEGLAFSRNMSFIPVQLVLANFYFQRMFPCQSRALGNSLRWASRAPSPDSANVHVRRALPLAGPLLACPPAAGPPPARRVRSLPAPRALRHRPALPARLLHALVAACAAAVWRRGGQLARVPRRADALLPAGRRAPG